MTDESRNICPVCDYPLSSYFVTVKDKSGFGVFVDTSCAIEQGWARKKRGKIIDTEKRPKKWKRARRSL